MKDWKTSLLGDYSEIVSLIQDAKNSLKSKKWKYYEASKELYEQEKNALIHYQDNFKLGSNSNKINSTTGTYILKY